MTDTFTLVIEIIEASFQIDDLEPVELDAGQNKAWHLPVSESDALTIEDVSLNFGDTISFTRFNKDTLEFSIDGSLLTE